MIYGSCVFRRYASNIKSLSISKILKSKPLNHEVNILGWLKNNRKHKEINFLHLDDGSSLKRLQVIAPKAICPKNLGYHACLSIKGKVVESPGSKQDLEVVADSIKVLSPGAPPDYPFVEQTAYLEEDIRSLPHFRPRTRNFASLLRVRAQTKSAIRKYFAEENFINVDTPILTTNTCEGGSQVFAVKGHGEMKGHKTVTPKDGAFGCPVYLTVSGQLHLEAVSSGVSKVYNFNPAFRGERGSRLHLHEFWMVEAEEAFMMGQGGYGALMDRMERLVKSVLREVTETLTSDVQFLWKHHDQEEAVQSVVRNAIEKPFAKLKFKEAMKILYENKEQMKNFDSISNDNLNREAELFLTKYCGDVPVFVTDWPVAFKPFYMYTEENENGEEIAFGVDLLVPNIGEIAGGSLREYRYDVLETKLKHINKDLDWYLKLRKFGHAPTAGFGIGFERLLQFMLGIDNVRDTIPFPRANGKCIC